MTIRTKRILSMLCLLIAGCCAKFAWDDHKQRVLYKEQEAIDDKILAELRREFRVGTAREKVISELSVHYPNLGSSGSDIDIWLDKEPSFSWYCSFWKPFIVFKFQGQSAPAPLVSIERETTGECL